MRKSYEAIKEEEIRENGIVPVKEKSGKRENTKKKTVRDIVDNLSWGWRGCTLQVLHKKTGYSKTGLKRYLDKLVSVRAVKKDGDMYFLDDDFKVRLIIPPPPYHLVWDRWLHLPEYDTPKVLESNKKGSAVKLVVKGKKPIPTKETVKRKLREYKKKREKEALG